MSYNMHVVVAFLYVKILKISDINNKNITKFHRISCLLHECQYDAEVVGTIERGLSRSKSGGSSGPAGSKRITHALRWLQIHRYKYKW